MNITKETLGSALQILPTGDNVEYTPPPNPATLLSFVNELGYPTHVSTLSTVITHDFYQPWRAIASLINLCLTGKTSGYERLRAPSLQILWGVVNGKDVNYVERIWEEFSQSIHSFLVDKANLEANKDGKKRYAKLLIPSIRFIKLIILSLQRSLKFHPREDSALHQPTYEHPVGYLKYDAKSTSEIIFGMDIPNALLTCDILTAPYYGEYIKLLKTSREASASKPSLSTKSERTSSKKRKGVITLTASSEGTKRVKHTTGSKRPSSKKTPSNENDPENAPSTTQLPLSEEEMVQIATAKSLKDAYMPPVPLVSGVSIKEPISDKGLRLQHVEGKGKDVAKEELAAHTLLKISSPASKSTSTKYIFKRRFPSSSSAKVSPDKTSSPSLGQPTNSSGSETDTSSTLKGDDSNLATQDVTSNKPVQDKAVGSETPIDPLHDEFVSTA